MSVGKTVYKAGEKLKETKEVVGEKLKEAGDKAKEARQGGWRQDEGSRQKDRRQDQRSVAQGPGACSEERLMIRLFPSNCAFPGSDQDPGSTSPSDQPADDLGRSIDRVATLDDPAR